MTAPLWIAAEEAVAINKLLVAQFGGLDAGVRDENLLQAALARPLNKWHYDEPKPTLHALAAAYAFGIAKGHAFHDGNKRAAYTVAVTFLEINGIVCAPEQAEIVETMVAVASGAMDERELTRWFQRNSRRGLSEAAAPVPRSRSKPRGRGTKRPPAAGPRTPQPATSAAGKAP